MTGEKSQEKGNEGKEFEVIPCQKCGELIDTCLDSYCRSCGEKIDYVLPKDLDKLNIKEGLDNAHDQDTRSSHEGLRSTKFFKFCPICGESLN